MENKQNKDLTGESSVTLCQKDYRIILDGTRNIMESLETGMETVKLLNEDIANNENILKQLEELKISFRESLSETRALLDDQTFVAEVMKQNIESFTSTAQTICGSALKLEDELTAEQTKFMSFSDGINEFSNKFTVEIEKYNRLESDFLNKLKETRRNNLESEEYRKLLIEENDKLKYQLEYLDKQITFTEEQLRSENDVAEKQIRLEQEIIRLKKEIANVNNDISITSDLITINKNEKQKEANKIRENIKKAHEKNVELESELQQKRDDLKQLEIEDNLATVTLLKLENDIKHSEEQLANSDKYLEKKNKSFMKTEKKFRELLTSCKEIISRNQLDRKFYNAMKEKLVEQMEKMKSEIKDLDVNLDALKADVAILEAKPHVNINEQKELQHKKFEELKELSKKLKEDYKSRVNNMKDTIKKSIAELEYENNKVMTINEGFAKEKMDMKTKIQQLQEEKDQCEKELNEQNSNPLVEPKPVKKVKRLRNWDSDSTVEGEDFTFAENARKKLQILESKSSKSQID